MSAPLRLCVLALAGASLAFTLRAAPLRKVEPGDIARLVTVDDPQLSPDGSRIVYTRQTSDLTKDKHPTNLWMVNHDGSGDRALTFGNNGQSHPRWSPDGNWIAYLSDRDDDNENSQLWLMPLAGGEGEKLTDLPNGVDDFAWAPDSRRLVLVARDIDARNAAARKADKDKTTPPPLVIDRYHFKQDIDGYLTEEYSHLWLFDRESRQATQLTSGKYDQVEPAWSPDGSRIAYVTKRGPDPDRETNWQIYVIAAAKGAAEQALTATREANNDPERESPPVWTPDGRSVVILHGGPPEDIEYATNQLATVPAGGGAIHVLTPKLDRNLSRAKTFGASVAAILENDGTETLVMFVGGSETPIPIAGGLISVTAFDVDGAGHAVVSASTPDRPTELYAAEDGHLRRLTHANDGWLAEVSLGRMEVQRWRSADGTEIHGFIVHPPVTHGVPPALLRPHGGPQGQYSAAFSLEAQLLATHGYTVILPNPRGSNGRGQAWGMALYDNWGGIDMPDDLAAVDDAVAHGWADPKRLGVGGWSYGGMATNYLIATTNRFKAATSGASISNILAGFGTDEYTNDYIREQGTPWEHLDRWMKISYPFYHADRIKTPTLFLVGSADFNVPLLNSEQMYQALKQLKIPTELVIYPGQFHHLTKPSYEIDRFQRYLAWYAKYLP